MNKGLTKEDIRNMSVCSYTVQAMAYAYRMVLETAYERLSNIRQDVAKGTLETAYTYGLDGMPIALDLLSDEERKQLADELAEHVRETIANYQPTKPEAK